MRFIRMVPKLPLDIIVPQYALRRRGAICVSVIGRDLWTQVRIQFFILNVTVIGRFITVHNILYTIFKPQFCITICHFI